MGASLVETLLAGSLPMFFSRMKKQPLSSAKSRMTFGLPWTGFALGVA